MKGVKNMNRLKELRQEKKLSQKELAENIGVHYRTLQNWENEESQIKPEKAKQLADFFGVSVGYLLNYSNSKKDPFDGYIPTPREYRSWQEFDYMQLSKTDLDFYDYEKLRKHLDPFALELMLNYFSAPMMKENYLELLQKNLLEMTLFHSKKITTSNII